MKSNNKILFVKFIKHIQDSNKLELFLNNIFEYKNLNSNKYVFNMQSINSKVIIDIYTKIDSNQYKRYIFDFKGGMEQTDGIIYIDVYNIPESKNKVFKLAYMFTLTKKEMYEYAKTFLDEELIDILKKIK